MMVWRIIFGLAALFNLAVGAIILLRPGDLSSVPFTGTPQEALLIQSCGWLIAVFGLGYGLAAIAPLANRGIIFLGVVGKAAMPVFAYPFYAAGHVPFESFALTLADLVFVGLFVWFLMTRRG
jgi:hypothetical protein